MIYISIFLLSLFSTNSEPDWGKYYVVGKAYDSDSLLIRNEQLAFINLHNKITKFKTNENGEFEMEVYWMGYDFDMTPVDRDEHKRLSDELNPPIEIFRNSDTIQIPNFWLEDSKLPFSERGIAVKYDLYF